MPPLTFGDYEVKCILRRNEKLIISFAGIGDLAYNVPEYEWVESLAAWNDNYSYIFIKDNSRSWYTSQNGIDELCLWLKEFIAEISYKETIAFGLSMGGYGAVIADSKVGFNLVITMSSRVFVGGEATFDPRLEMLSSKVPVHPNNSALNLFRPDGVYVYLYSIDDLCDMMHAVRLFGANRPNVRLLKTRGQHNIGYNLKKTSSLEVLFDWMFIQRCETTHFAFDPFTNITFEIATTLEHMGYPRSLTYETYEGLLSQYPVEHIPRILLDDILQHSTDDAIESFKHSQQLSQMSCSEHAEVHRLPLVAYCYLRPEEFARNLRFGWSGLEDNGCWAVGKWHCIQGHVIGLKSPQNALRIEYDVYLPMGKTQVLKFYLHNADTLILETFHENEDRSGVAVIPFSGNFLSILIETPYFTSPQLNGLGEDHRNISLFVKSISVIATSSGNSKAEHIVS